MTRIPADQLETVVSALFQAAGLNSECATVCAENLVYANLRGIDGHGVVRVPHYLDRLQRGSTRADAVPRFEHVAPTLGLLDANHGMGQVAGTAAMARAVPIAAEFGTAFVAVRNSGHFGAAGYYGQQAARDGFATLIFANTDQIVAPFGGRKTFFGSNPIACIFPGPGEPVTIDLATSAIPYGKVVLAKTEGRSIPPDWGLDAEGHPTTDPAAVVALHHMAGPKGFALAMVIELLTSLITGGPYGPDIPAMYGAEDQQRLLSHAFLVIHLERFLPMSNYRERVAEMVERLHAVPPAEGFKTVLAPGEPEQQTRAERLANGIPLDTGTLEALRKSGRELAVAVPFGS